MVEKEVYGAAGSRIPSPDASNQPTLSSALDGKLAGFQLTDKFQAFRPIQTEALERILVSKAKYIILQAPTGTGKTLIGVALQKITGRGMAYVVKTIQLEEQIARDFPHGVLLKGRSNYPTHNKPNDFPRINAELCMMKGAQHCSWCCSGKEMASLDQLDEEYSSSCDGRSRCPYFQQKLRAMRASLAIVNISLFLTEAQYTGAFSQRDWVVLDEADTIEDSLMNFVGVTITEKWVERFHLPAPRFKTKQDSWVDWAKEEALPKLREQLKALLSVSTWKLSDLQDEREVSSAIDKLMYFVHSASNSMWVYKQTANTRGELSHVFKPVFVAHHGQSHLWCHGKRFLLMSATIVSPDQMVRDLGIPPSEMEFINLPSTFSPRRRLVHYVPGPAMSNKTRAEAWPEMVQSMDNVLKGQRQVKTLVHTVSAELARYVKEHSKFRAQMITYGDGMRREEALRRFIHAHPPSILVAQGMERGVDLLDDLCRCIIILKIPFPNLGDQQVQKRVYSVRDGQEWYMVRTWRSLIQATGRGMRHEADYCQTFILDAQFGKILWRSKRLAPRWWLEAVRWSEK